MDDKIERKSKNKDRSIQNANLTPGGPGRPKGQRNYKTIYREALHKLAELNDKDPNDLEDEIVQMAIKKARGGDFSFYKELMDRLHGKPIQKTDVTSGGEQIVVQFHESFKKKRRNKE